VDFGAPDGVAVTLIFLILSPAQAPAQHLQALARISRLLRWPGVADSLRQAGSPDQIVQTLREAEKCLPVPV
jgi:PTS system nitrogen regulatory IIA component